MKTLLKTHIIITLLLALMFPLSSQGSSLLSAILMQKIAGMYAINIDSVNGFQLPNPDGGIIMQLSRTGDVHIILVDPLLGSLSEIGQVQPIGIEDNKVRFKLTFIISIADPDAIYVSDCPVTCTEYVTVEGLLDITTGNLRMNGIGIWMLLNPDGTQDILPNSVLFPPGQSYFGVGFSGYRFGIDEITQFLDDNGFPQPSI